MDLQRDYEILEGITTYMIVKEFDDLPLIDVILHFLCNTTARLFEPWAGTTLKTPKYLVSKSADLYSTLHRYKRHVVARMEEITALEFAEANKHTPPVTATGRITLFRMQELGLTGGDPIILSDEEKQILADKKRKRENKPQMLPTWTRELENTEGVKITGARIRERASRAGILIE
jgi:hypothetical protein